MTTVAMARTTKEERLEQIDPKAQKIEKPHAFFVEPHDVVIDPALSKAQKTDILDTLEQDARQMSAASNEGMAGGELANLHEVLEAKDSLELPPIAHAYDLVVKDLRSRMKTDLHGDSRALIEVGLTAMEAVVSSDILNPGGHDPNAGLVVRMDPDVAAGIDDEIAREKLDP